ncbi:CDP-glycerol glycerophosphotransferase family protein [Bacillus altitudinis]|uniref:CDP-glycerol glycerophosphotransferase family protein n=1 Tax=Bacillus altitudinis TaxID=293387 RepID=A0ABV1S0L3_BACAB|nr:CDP-glycerol glycerophosphotransferase family protein [Bacillus altitudinis]MBY0184879.1 CDP-glycerol glycerophosphotransferase family protein [Bacillus aerophilus]WQH38502.1 CDP-glycerol glycerophosphotransferase family protein [Bacillus altitudinis]
MIEETIQQQCKVESLQKHQEEIELLISVVDPAPFEGREFFLLIIERKSQYGKYLPLVYLSENLYKVTLNELSLQIPFEQGQTYNFYVTDFDEQQLVELNSSHGWMNATQPEENKYFMKRLEINIDMPEMSHLVNHQSMLLMTPYRTNKGNLSIKVKREMKIVRFKNINLTDNREILLSGYTGVLSAEKRYKVKRVQLLIKQIEEPLHEYRFPVSIRKEGLELEEQKHVSYPELYLYESKFSLDELEFSLKERFVYRFYFEFICETNGIEETLTTPALRLGDRSNKLKGLVQIHKKNDVPIRYEVYRTKKRQLLGIRINDYTMKTRAKYYLKSKWKKFKKKIGKINKVRNRLVTKTFQTTFQLASKLSVKKKTVVFESFNGKQFSCNPRGIYEYMKENHPEYTLIWSVKKGHEAPFQEKGIYYIKRLSLKWIFAMARAEYWVINSRLPLWVPKPEHTTYLQTWHGTPLKRLAMDMDEVHMPGTNTKKYKKNFTKEASNWDYLISPNAYSTEIFTRAFQFQKTMIESGYPRNDFLHNQNNEKTMRALKQKMKLPLDKKMILYAPTWRDDQFYKKGQYKFDLDLNLHEMRAALGDEYVIILRMHYLVAENFDLRPYEGFAYDFSHYEDIRDLYMISDLLITDYSSVFFDYANLKRPMLFYVPDIETYRDKLRGFYFDFEQEAPGPLVKETASVIEWIRETEQPTFTLPASFAPFYEKFCYLESGESSKRVVEVVFETIR